MRPKVCGRCVVQISCHTICDKAKRSWMRSNKVKIRGLGLYLYCDCNLDLPPASTLFGSDPEIWDIIFNFSADEIEEIRSYEEISADEFAPLADDEAENLRVKKKK